MTEQSFADVWDAIEADPTRAAELKQRSDLIMILDDFIKQSKLSPAKAAAKLGVTRKQICYLLDGKITFLELGLLNRMAGEAGLT